MTKEKAKQIIKAHGLGYTIEEWDKAIAVIFDEPSFLSDDFIEKACEYLQINLWRVVNEEPDFRQRFVTDFKNYMKGN